eukprot:394562-Rhodomonas_salina.3
MQKLQEHAGKMSEQVQSAMILRASYAMSGTDLAYGAAMGLRASDAMSGTDLAYGPVGAYGLSLIHISEPTRPRLI